MVYSNDSEFVSQRIGTKKRIYECNVFGRSSALVLRFRTISLLTRSSLQLRGDSYKYMCVCVIVFGVLGDEIANIVQHIYIYHRICVFRVNACDAIYSI